MHGSRIVSGLAAVLGGMAALFAVLAVAYNPVFLAVAAVFGVAAAMVWYHASGRFARRLYRGVESRAEPGRSAGFGPGPREEWEPPRDGETARARAGPRGEAGGRGAGRTAGTGRRGRTRQARAQSGGLTRREAYEALGLDPDADESAVREAYRRKAKEVHPDRPAGDEEEFKEVKAAYERLTD